MKTTILIVDDEHMSRSFVHDLVLEQAPDAEIHEAESAEEALSLLGSRPFDIVFSDIKMPHKDGFGMLHAIPHRDFDLIFITAYSQYAIQAIKEGAFDYILKPIRKTEFRTTFEKVLRKKAQEKAEQSPGSTDYLDNKVSIGHKEGIKFIALKDIVYLQASNTYTIIVLSNGEKVIASKPISKFESRLSQQWFFRVHKSHIVNIYHFREYLSKGGDMALMSNGEKIYISRYRLNPFLACVENSSGKIRI